MLSEFVAAFNSFLLFIEIFGPDKNLSPVIIIYFAGLKCSSPLPFGFIVIASILGVEFFLNSDLFSPYLFIPISSKAKANGIQPPSINCE